MKILITGGCGFFGHHLVEHLLKNSDADIVILDKLSYASSGFDRLRDISVFDDARVRVLGCDLSQAIPDGVTREIGDDLDYIIHTAAETHVDNSIIDPVPFLKSNVMGTHHLLWWARRLKTLRRAFLVSTDEVYGPAEFSEDVVGFDEDAPFRPANPYAAAKAGGECVAMAYANTYKLPITIVNTMNLFGERQNAEKFLPLVIRKTLHGEEVTIHADPTTTISGSRFYIHARTFAHALNFLVSKASFGSEEDLPLKLHVCGEREISNLDLAKMIAGYVGKPLRYKMVSWHESRPGHDLRYAMSDRRIVALGWRRPMMIERSLEKTVRWYLDNPKWLEVSR